MTGHVNVTSSNGALVLQPTGRFDEGAAELLDELVKVATSNHPAVVVDLGQVGAATPGGLRLIPRIEARATAVRNRPGAG